MSRAHLSKAVVRRVSGVPADGTVAVKIAGTTTDYAGTLYADGTSGTTLSNPFSFTNGQIDFFTVSGGRVKLIITPTGSSAQTFDDVDIPLPGDYTPPVTISSTTGLGLPTTSGRNTGDLHYDRIGQREYTLVNGAWVSSSGAVATVGAGLPVFAGRAAGDHHFNSTTLKDYVLTGTIGSTFSDDFSSGSLSSYTNSGFTSSGGHLVFTNGSGTQSKLAYNLGAGVPHAAQADVAIKTGTADFSFVGVQAKAASDFSTGYFFCWDGGVYRLFRSGSGVGTPSTFTPGTSPAGTTVTMAIAVDAAGVVTCSVNGTPVITYTDGSPLTGAYTGVQVTSNNAGSTTTLDNFYTFTAGTLAWTVSQPAAAAGVTSTTSFGVPTTSGRLEGDLHYDKAGQREYTLATVSGTLTWVSSSGAVNTVGAGTPTFVGRAAGDHHFDSTALKDYVLTGAPGGSYGDSFTRADNTSLGNLETPSSTAWLNGAAMPSRATTDPMQIVGALLGCTTFASVDNSAQFAVAAAYPSETTFDVVDQGTSNHTNGFSVAVGMTSNSTATTSWRFDYGSGTTAGNNGITLRAPDGTTATVTNLVFATGARASFRMVLSSDGKTCTVYKDGTSVVSATSASAPAGTSVGFRLANTSTSNKSFYDNVAVLSSGTYAWTASQPTVSQPGFQSTTAFGLPTTTGRSNGDLHYDTLTQREYVLSAGVWAATTGPTSTQAAGLPTFAGRAPGDLAFDTTAGRQYVLTGTPGSSFSDDFSGSLSGYTNINNGGGAGSMGIVSGRLTETNSGVRPTALFRSIGSGVPHVVQADVIFNASLASLFNLAVTCKSGAATAQGDGYAFRYTGSGGVYNLVRNTTVVATYDAGSSPAGTTKTLSIQATTAGVVTCFINGGQVLSYTDGSPLTGAYGGVDMNDSTASQNFFDNLVLSSSGTLAWTLTQSSSEPTTQVAAAGAALTIQDPIATGVTLTRAILSANTTITLPSPATVAATQSKSLTVVLVQDGTGGRTVTWATPSGSILWAGGTAPTQTATASKGDVYTFLSDGGGNWIAFVAGQNF